MPEFLTETLREGGDVTDYMDLKYSQPLDWQGFCKLGEQTTSMGSRWPDSVSLKNQYFDLTQDFRKRDRIFFSKLQRRTGSSMIIIENNHRSLLFFLVNTMY